MREALSDKFKNENNLNYTPDEIIVTAGAGEGLFIAIQSLVETGDRVLLTDPGFVSYEACIQFAGGKFRIKQWGRVKIKYALKQKQVSEYCIKKALLAIDENDYHKTAQKLFAQKLKTLKSEKNIFIKKRKLQDHLMQKGFETTLISKLIVEIK